MRGFFFAFLCGGVLLFLLRLFVKIWNWAWAPNQFLMIENFGVFVCTVVVLIIIGIFIFGRD